MSALTTHVTLNTGAKLPLVGLTTPNIKKSDTKRAVIAAIDNGFRFFDTAYLYDNEVEVGEAIRECIQAGKVTRNELFVATKLPSIASRSDKVLHFLKMSLKRLQLDYVDLYYLHTPLTYKYVNDATLRPVDSQGNTLFDYGVDFCETWKVMEDGVHKGFAKALGVTNFNSQQIQQIWTKATLKPSVLFTECHAYLTQRELQAFCEKLNMRMISFCATGPGKLSQVKDLPFLVEDPVIIELGKKYNKTPAQIATRFVIQRGMPITIHEFDRATLKANIETLKFALSDEDMDAIYKLDKKMRSFTFAHVKG